VDPGEHSAGEALDHFLRLDINLYPSQSGGAVVDWFAFPSQFASGLPPNVAATQVVEMPISTPGRTVEALRRSTGFVSSGVEIAQVPARRSCLRMKGW
jgi:hypothetical protein